LIRFPGDAAQGLCGFRPSLAHDRPERRKNLLAPVVVRPGFGLELAPKLFEIPIDHAPVDQSAKQPVAQIGESRQNARVDLPPLLEKGGGLDAEPVLVPELPHVGLKDVAGQLPLLRAQQQNEEGVVVLPVHVLAAAVPHLTVQRLGFLVLPPAILDPGQDESVAQAVLRVHLERLPGKTARLFKALRLVGVFRQTGKQEIPLLGRQLCSVQLIRQLVRPPQVHPGLLDLPERQAENAEVDLDHRLVGDSLVQLQQPGLQFPRFPADVEDSLQLFLVLSVLMPARQERQQAQEQGGVPFHAQPTSKVSRPNSASFTPL
jgi:hypothetical protein